MIIQPFLFKTHPPLYYSQYFFIRLLLQPLKNYAVLSPSLYMFFYQKPNQKSST